MIVLAGAALAVIRERRRPAHRGELENGEGKELGNGELVHVFPATWMGHSFRPGGEQVNTTARTYAHPTGEYRTAALDELEKFVAAAEDGQRTSATG